MDGLIDRDRGMLFIFVGVTASLQPGVGDFVPETFYGQNTAKNMSRI